MDKNNQGNTLYDLAVWQTACQQVMNIYGKTKDAPREELFSLIYHMWKAGSMTVSNVAEAFDNMQLDSKLQILKRAQRSLSECRCYFDLSGHLKYVTTNELKAYSDEVARQLRSYKKVLQKRNDGNSKG